MYTWPAHTHAQLHKHLRNKERALKWPVVSSKSQKLQDSPTPPPLSVRAKVLSVVPRVLVSSFRTAIQTKPTGHIQAPPGHLYLFFCAIICCRVQRRKNTKQHRWIVNTQFSGVEVKDGPLISTKPRRLRAFKITGSTQQGQKNCWFFQRRYKRNRVENRLYDERTLISVPAYWELLSHVMKLSMLAPLSRK